jgi:hypothetical protein
VEPANGVEERRPPLGRVQVEGLQGQRGEVGVEIGPGR